jgi:hypothetical protein
MAAAGLRHAFAVEGCGKERAAGAFLRWRKLVADWCYIAVPDFEHCSDKLNSHKRLGQALHKAVAALHSHRLVVGCRSELPGLRLRMFVRYHSEQPGLDMLVRYRLELSDLDMLVRYRSELSDSCLDMHCCIVVVEH